LLSDSTTSGFWIIMRPKLVTKCGAIWAIGLGAVSRRELVSKDQPHKKISTFVG